MPRGEMGILKVILILLLSLLALLLLILALNVRLSVLLGDSTTWRITLGGIPIDPDWFSGKKNKHPKREKKKKGNERGKADTAPAGDKTLQPEKKKKKSGAELVVKLLRTLARYFPKSFRIKIKRLKITVGNSDAALCAVEYGAIYGALSAAFAVLEGYRGLFYGFRAKRENTVINIDYTKEHTRVSGRIDLCFFIWQLLFLAVRLGIAYILHILEKDERTDY